ncbi:helix-turn-helix domain-containing protein [Kribbella sp. NPDC026596]|uniref:TetR/AcrR family transcriptional regulator n=1 Tax=Kribbella sp. NPDC026596 TaxID=3155122 RepID=UPI0033E02643
MSDRLSHSLRSDAADNRDRIVEAARALFATEGMTVTMRQIARRAGIGPATLYRRFPTKQLLAAEAFAEQVRDCRAIVDDGLAEEDPWRGFCQVIERICEVNADSRGFTEAFLATYPGAADFTVHREYTLRAVARLAERAKKTGHLRADFTSEDLVMMLSAHGGIRATNPALRRAASRRFAALTIQAFRAWPARLSG